MTINHLGIVLAIIVCPSCAIISRDLFQMPLCVYEFFLLWSCFGKQLYLHTQTHVITITYGLYGPAFALIIHSVISMLCIWSRHTTYTKHAIKPNVFPCAFLTTSIYCCMHYNRTLTFLLIQSKCNIFFINPLTPKPFLISSSIFNLCPVHPPPLLTHFSHALHSTVMISQPCVCGLA